jgi:hypothetical protein
VRLRTGILLIPAVLATGLVMLASAGAVGARSNAAPINTAEPVITGNSYRVGQTLTGTSGSWTGTEPITYAGQWVRCPPNGGQFDGSDCGNISGANGQFYELQNADVGFRLRLRVTATNADGSNTVASNPTPLIEAVALVKPQNTKAPSISGSTLVGSLLTLNRGTWTGSAPITYTYIWARCNTSGASCSAISGATGTQYRLGDADEGKTIRVQVTAKNAAGSASAASTQTAVVRQPAPPDTITLPSGEKSIPATSVPKGERLVVQNVAFSPNPVTTRDQPITARIRIKDTRGYVVRGAVVFIRSTPRVTTGGDQRVTELDGWVTYQLQPLNSFPLKKGWNVQFFVKAYRVGDPSLAGISGRRLVQVRTVG